MPLELIRVGQTGPEGAQHVHVREIANLVHGEFFDPVERFLNLIEIVAQLKRIPPREA